MCFIGYLTRFLRQWKATNQGSDAAANGGRHRTATTKRALPVIKIQTSGPQAVQKASPAQHAPPESLGNATRWQLLGRGGVHGASTASEGWWWAFRANGGRVGWRHGGIESAKASSHSAEETGINGAAARSVWNTRRKWDWTRPVIIGLISLFIELFFLAVFKSWTLLKLK